MVDPRVCTHDNVEYRQVYDESASMYSETLGGLAVYHYYCECPDCNSKWTTEEFEALCNEAYMRASAEARYFDYGYWELYGHLPKVCTQPPASEDNEQ